MTEAPSASRCCRTADPISPVAPKMMKDVSIIAGNGFGIARRLEAWLVGEQHPKPRPGQPQQPPPEHGDAEPREVGHNGSPKIEVRLAVLAIGPHDRHFNNSVAKAVSFGHNLKCDAEADRAGKFQCAQHARRIQFEAVRRVIRRNARQPLHKATGKLRSPDFERRLELFESLPCNSAMGRRYPLLSAPGLTGARSE